MKHQQPVASPLQTETDLLDALRAQLGTADRRELARRLGVTPFRLSQILRGTWPVPDDVAAALGFRRVARFEPIDS